MTQGSIDSKLTKIEMVPLGKIKENPKNPNRHSEEQINALCEQLKYQGWRHPLIVCSETGMLVVGHGRLEAARKLGLPTAPVSKQKFDSDEQRYAFMVADNAIAAWAELDFKSIQAQLPDLGPELDISLLGIRDFTLDAPLFDEGPTEPEKQKKLKQCPECGCEF